MAVLPIYLFGQSVLRKKARPVKGVDADLVKFAKYTPVPSENEAVIPQALDIVERTKPKEEVPQNV